MLRKFIPILPLVFAFSIALPSPAEAGTCGSVTSVASDIWTKYGSLAPALPYAKKVDEMIKFWNSNVGGTWARLGPRDLIVNTEHAGTVVGPGERVFIAETPLNTTDVTVRVEKLAGKAKTNVTVCSVDQAGRAVKVWEFTAPKGGGTKTWKKTIGGMKDKILTVHLAGKSASKKFKYTLEASK
ncbi:MAG: hypothetical protein ACRBN8_15110 [Nannocystales bacterium]